MKKAIMDFSKYRLESNDLVICEPCLTFVFFSDLQISSDEPPDLLAPYRVFVDRFGSHVSYCRTSGTQMHAKIISENDLAMPAKWLSNPKKRVRLPLDIELFAGKVRNEWRAPCIDMSHCKSKPQRTYCRIRISLEDYEQWGLNGVLSYLNNSLTGFPLLSGYVGFSFVWNSSDPKVKDATEPYFHHWLQRHPGLMTPNVLSQDRVAPFSLVDLGWITLLGKTYCDRLGGFDNLCNSLKTLPYVTVKAIENEGALIRIDDAPRLGDIKKGDNLEEYRAVGTILKPLRDRNFLHQELLVRGLYDRNSSTIQSKWIDRFFPD